MAADLLLKSAQQGYSEAQFIVGGIYNLGIGVSQDDLKSYEWYRKAAERGYADAQYVIGSRYFYGKVVPQDGVEAAYWFMLAANNHSSFLKDEKDRLLLGVALTNLSPEQLKIVRDRVANWEPVRTASEQGNFENLVLSQERLIVARLMYLNFSKEQASKILGAYKEHLFGGIENRELKSEQMQKIFSTAEKQLASVQANSNRYDETAVRVISELTK
jgi:TPR repeat protein